MGQQSVMLSNVPARAEVSGGLARPNLREIFGPEPWYNVRPSVSDPGWMSRDQSDLDALTGTQLVIAGDTPILCHASVVSDRALSILSKAGLAPAPHFTVYRTPGEYLAYLAGTTRKCAMQFVHPLHEFESNRYWVPRELLCFLNNKGNLHRLASAPCVPERHLLKKGERRPSKFPVVVKVASEEPSGSGQSVRICRNALELRKARTELGKQRQLVIEEFLPIRRNLCIQYAVLPDGGCHYLGTSEQITDEAGAYLGNWIDGDCSPSPAALLASRITIERAALLGYRGVAGFDAAELVDGRVFLFDLNFRINGSTTALLLLPAITRRHGEKVLRIRGWPYNGGFRAMAAHVEEWLDKGLFLPFTLRQPMGGSVKPRVAGVLMGETRRGVTALEKRWEALGFGG